MLAQTPEAYLRYVVVMTTLGFLFIEAHRRTAPGRAWALIRRSEAAAMAAGVNVTLYKTWAFGIAGLLAGASGALLAASLGLLDDGTFRSSESIMLFALAVVGGARFWLGPVIAAVLYRVLPALLSSWGVNANLAYVIFGVGLLHALITAPNGIAGQIFDAARALSAQVGGRNDRDRSGRGPLRRRCGAERGFRQLHRPGRRHHRPERRGQDHADECRLGLCDRQGRAGLWWTAPISWRCRRTNAPRSGLRRSFQKEQIADDLTVFENVLVQLDSPHRRHCRQAGRGRPDAGRRRPDRPRGQGRSRCCPALNAA